MRAALVVVALAACVEPAPPIEPQVTSHVARMVFAPMPSYKLDLLFVIDSSPAMAPHLAHLDAKLPLLMNSLGLGSRGLPDLHVGVITANGTGQMRGQGPVTGSYISDVAQTNGTRTKNYTGNLVDVFRAYASVGAESTAASRPFEALDLSFRNPVNAGFIREDAVLAVVFVTATDDASTSEIATHVARLKARYADPSRIIVSAISAPRVGSNPCGAAAAPRIHAFLDGFPHHNVAASICHLDFDAISIGPLFKTTLGLPCWELAPLDLDDRPGEQRACSAVLTTPAYGEYIDVVIRECGSTPTSPCWRIVDEPLCGEGGHPPLTTLLEPGSAGLPRDTFGVIECVVAAPSGQNP